MCTVQSDSNNLSLFHFHFLLNIMQKCRTIELSDYRAARLSIRMKCLLLILTWNSFSAALVKDS